MCARSFRCFSRRDALFLPFIALLASTIILLRAFSRFELLGAALFLLPMSEPYFSRPSRPFSIDAMRSA